MSFLFHFHTQHTEVGKSPRRRAGSTGSISDGSCLATQQGLSWILQSWKQEIPLLNTKCFLRIINATHNTNDWRIRSRQWLFLSTIRSTWFSCQEKFWSFVGTGCNLTKLLSDCSLRVKAAECRRKGNINVILHAVLAVACSEQNESSPSLPVYKTVR